MAHSSKKTILSWCLFDWAHSGFPTVITTFVFGTYFMKSVVQDVDKGTAEWAWILGISGVIIAIISPFAGAISDQRGNKKSWLIFFTLVCIVFTSLLWFTKPEPSYTLWAVWISIIAHISFESIQVFYNSMLIDIAPIKKLGRLSGWGWGTGYIGGLICMVCALYMIKSSWITHEEDLNIRATNLLVAIWLFVFAIPLFIWGPKSKKKNKPSITQAIKEGVIEISKTFRMARKYSQIFRFLIARLLYIDGLNTLLSFVGIFAAGSFGMSIDKIMIFAILSNALAGIGAFALAWLDDLWGSKKTIVLSLGMIFILSSILLLLKSVVYFWILGLLISSFVGPAQAASRSYLARCVPSHMASEFFGIYSLSGRLTAFIGPMLLSFVTLMSGSQRVGLFSTLAFILAGLFILFFLPEAKMIETHDTSNKDS